MENSKFLSTMLFFAITILFPISFAANAKSSKCEFEDVGYSFVPKANCKEETQILDSLGCLNANGKISQHCKKETWCNSECEPPGVKKYACRDFKICVDESANNPTSPQKNNSKKPRPEFKDELVRSVH